jgi:hypothetical protein
MRHSGHSICCEVNGTDHVEVKEAVVHRRYQGVRCRMGKAAQIAIRPRRVDDDEINIPLERVDRIDKPLAFKLFIVSDLYRLALLDAAVDWHFEIEPGMGCPSTTIVYVARKALLTSVEIDCSNPLAAL